MSDFKPNLAFKLIDPLFLKLGKPLARHIAEKDKTENILLKRENQTKLIINTALKVMRRSVKILEKPSSQLACRVFNLIGLSLCTFLSARANLNFFDLMDQLALSVSMVTVTWDVFGTVYANQMSLEESTRFYFNQNAIFLLKEDSFRFKHFYTINKVTMLSLIYNLINFPIYSSIIFMHHITTFSIILIYLYSFAIAFAFINWTYNYILMGVIYHSDDFGEKEKQTSKEEKTSMVFDAV